MTDTSALTAALAAYRRFADLACGLGPADLDRPTRLAGWRVRDLVDHVAWGMSMEADALRRGLVGDPGPATCDDPAGGLEDFAAAIEEMEDPELLVPLPTGTVPLGFAAPLFALEAVVHASDLADALGRDASLSPDELAAALPVVPGMLGFLGTLGQRPDGPVCLALRGGVLGWDLAWDGSGWEITEEREDAGEYDAVMTGSDEEVLLRMLGRTPVRSSLRIAGDADLADRLKEWFPGP